LTDDELERLYKDYGKELTDKAIDYLDGYIVEKKYKSASHNLAMRRWVFDAVSKKNYSNTYNNTNIVKQEEEKKDENGIPEDISRRIAQLKKQGYTDEQLKLVADFKPYLS
jgi:predicted Ser/Thr protein kinase